MVAEYIERTLNTLHGITDRDCIQSLQIPVFSVFHILCVSHFVCFTFCVFHILCVSHIVCFTYCVFHILRVSDIVCFTYCVIHILNVRRDIHSCHISRSTLLILYFSNSTCICYENRSVDFIHLMYIKAHEVFNLLNLMSINMQIYFSVEIITEFCTL